MRLLLPIKAVGDPTEVAWCRRKPQAPIPSAQPSRRNAGVILQPPACTREAHYHQLPACSSSCGSRRITAGHRDLLSAALCCAKSVPLAFLLWALLLWESSNVFPERSGRLPWNHCGFGLKLSGNKSVAMRLQWHLLKSNAVIRNVKTVQIQSSQSRVIFHCILLETQGFGWRSVCGDEENSAGEEKQ